jgi:hypothetical protein
MLLPAQQTTSKSLIQLQQIKHQVALQKLAAEAARQAAA